MNTSYDEWQSKLSDEFFQPKLVKSPIIMFLDDDELSSICPEALDATESLRLAVRSELRQTDKIGVVGGIHRRVETWRTGPREDPPPCLPLLALTVVAGSRMRNDGEFSSKAYYPRLADLMSSDPDDLRARGLRKHFDVVATMWQHLDTWIADNQHKFGPSTISTHQFFSLIGYPLSQTVLKTSDRERLGDFFERILLDSRSAPSSDELLRLLRYWLDRPRGLSKSFLRLVEQDPLNPLLAELLLKLASEERSAVAKMQRRINLSLRLCIDLEQWTSGWVIPTHDELDTDELKMDDGSIVSISRPAYGSNYELSSENRVLGQWSISKPFRAVGRRAVLVKDVQDIWILRIDPTSGKWQSVDSMEPGYDHLLMVRTPELPAITQLLALRAEPGYRKLRSELIQGWTLIADVLVANRIDPTAASEGDFAYVFKTDIGPSPKLVNGLALKTEVGGRHFLQGGEPDLLIPPGHSERYVDVELDGVSQEPPLKATGVPLPLRIFGPMSEGKHTVQVDGLKLDFFVQRTGTDAVSQAGLARVGYSPADKMLVDVGPIYAVCRRGKNGSIWFITPSGKALQHREPRMPDYLPKSTNWKVAVPDDATWVVVERNGQFAPPQHIRDGHVEFGRLDQNSEYFWRRITPVAITNSDRKWREYLAQFLGAGIYGR